MNSHKHHDVLVAIAKGKKVEYYDPIFQNWVKPNNINPISEFEYMWRVAPEQPWQKALMEAVIRGEVVETKCSVTREWVYSSINEFKNPFLYEFPADANPYDYRVRPKIIHRYLTVRPNYTGTQTEKQYDCDTLRLTYDDNSKKLIQVEILK